MRGTSSTHRIDDTLRKNLSLENLRRREHMDENIVNVSQRTKFSAILLRTYTLTKTS
jgi:hypothetical protein